MQSNLFSLSAYPGFFWLLTLAGSAVANAPVEPQGPGPFGERFLLRVGLMYSNQNTQLRLDGDTLGLDGIRYQYQR